MSKTYRNINKIKSQKKLNLKSRRYKLLKEYLGHTVNNHKINRLKNYCQLTGAARSYHSQFALSRHSLRKLMYFGLIPGVTQASW